MIMFDNMFIKLIVVIWTLMIICEIVSMFGILPMPVFPTYTCEESPTEVGLLKSFLQLLKLSAPHIDQPVLKIKGERRKE